MKRLIISPCFKITVNSGRRTRNVSSCYHAKEKLNLENVPGKAQG